MPVLNSSLASAKSQLGQLSCSTRAIFIIFDYSENEYGIVALNATWALDRSACSHLLSKSWEGLHGVWACHSFGSLIDPC